MQIVGLVTGLVLLFAGLARADVPQQCKATVDCGANAVCTAEGKCIALPPQAPPTTPTLVAEDPAETHFKQGVNLFNKGDYAGALAEWKASYAITPAPVVLKNIAFAQQKLFQYVDALESLEKFIANPGDEDVTEAQKILDDVRKLVVEVKLAVLPAKDVVVKIDGREVGKLPLTAPLKIATGNHAIELSLDGYESVKRDVVVASGVAVDLGKIELKLIPKTGKVRINSPVPRATVSIDGQPRGPAPIEVELSGGGHLIEVTAPDYQTHRGDLNVTAGQTRDVNISLDKVVVVAKAGRPWYKKWYIVAPLSAVVVGGGIGTYLFVTATPDPIPGTLDPGVKGL